MSLTLVYGQIVKSMAIVSAVFLGAGVELGVEHTALAQVTPDGSMTVRPRLVNCKGSIYKASHLATCQR